MPYLDELDSRGYRYYFDSRSWDTHEELDPNSPATAIAAETFRELAERVGPRRVIWRYDPIIFTEITSPSFHQENFHWLASRSGGI